MRQYISLGKSVRCCRHPRRRYKFSYLPSIRCVLALSGTSIWRHNWPLGLIFVSLSLSSVVFCINPGPLANGRIYVTLKDDRGSSMPIRNEFRSYIPNVGHGRTIEFECYPGNSTVFLLVPLNFHSWCLGFTLQGPSGLTCNHGRWMPAERPRCITGKI